MRLGGPVFSEYKTPTQWVAAVKALGYRAAYCPVGPAAGDDEVAAYAAAAAQADIVIAEVGAWYNNPLSSNPEERRTALKNLQAALRLADRIGARCCVNVAGSRGANWAGPCAQDLTAETFALIVESVRRIIDEVQPTRTFYTIEAMPWMYPDSADGYVELLRAVDRPTFAVHFDPVNLICSPQRYFRNGEIIREFVAKLGPQIKSCHAKDTLLGDQLTVHLAEVRPGCGALDYPVYLAELAKLPGDVPLMLEHLPNAAEFAAAAAYIRQTAQRVAIAL